MESLCGIRENSVSWSPHGVLYISDSPSGLHMESMETIGNYWEMQYGVLNRHLHGVHVDSM